MTATDTAVNLQPIIQPILEVIALVIASLIATYIPKAIAAFEKRTGVQIAAVQQTALVQAVQAAAGTVETRIDQKIMAVSEVHIDNPAVRTLANEAITNAGAIAGETGLTEAGVARMIVGATQTAPRCPAPLAVAAPVPEPYAAGL
jgi:hypothetical protein